VLRGGLANPGQNLVGPSAPVRQACSVVGGGAAPVGWPVAGCARGRAPVGQACSVVGAPRGRAVGQACSVGYAAPCWVGRWVAGWGPCSMVGPVFGALAPAFGTIAANHDLTINLKRRSILIRLVPPKDFNNNISQWLPALLNLHLFCSMCAILQPGRRF
jgi:hypothetical protein